MLEKARVGAVGTLADERRIFFTRRRRGRDLTMNCNFFSKYLIY